MKRLLVLLAVGAATAVVCANGAGAAPIPGATFVRGTWWTPPYYLFVTGLTDLGCPFQAQDGIPEAATSQLTYAYDGWVGPLVGGAYQQVSLKTRVSGALQDAEGNTYQVKGLFRDNSTIYGDLYFAGVGRVTFSGPAGLVAGTAELRIVTGPDDYSFNFTGIQRCTIAP